MTWTGNWLAAASMSEKVIDTNYVQRYKQSMRNKLRTIKKLFPKHQVLSERIFAVGAGSRQSYTILGVSPDDLALKALKQKGINYHISPAGDVTC